MALLFGRCLIGMGEFRQNVYAVLSKDLKINELVFRGQCEFVVFASTNCSTFLLKIQNAWYENCGADDDVKIW